MLMKTLINANFRALRTGEYVKADTDAGEFIFDSSLSGDDQLEKSTLTEIANKNKISVGKKDNKDTIVEKLESGIKELKLPEQNEKTETEVVHEIVQKGFAEGKEDEDMVIEIIEAGVKLKAAYRMFQNAAQELGLRITTKERKEKISEILLGDEFEPETYDDVNAMADRIVKEVPDTTTSQAISAIRRYCKDNELDFPKPAKKPRGGFRARAFAWMVANPDASKVELGEWVAKQDKDEKTTDRLWTLFEFAKQVRAAD